MAALWGQSVPYHQDLLVGTKAHSIAFGTARCFVLSKEPSWVSLPGVLVLSDHLQQHLGLPQMPEMRDFMAKHFRNSRRHKHETMSDYISMHVRALHLLESKNDMSPPSPQQGLVMSRGRSAEKSMTTNAPQSSSRTASEIHEATSD